MATGFQFTLLSLKIGKIFVADRHNKHWNYEVTLKVGATDKGVATYKVLKEFQQHGWVKGTHECAANGRPGRPRVLYELTDAGAKVMGAALLALQLAST